jgi:uncharacterized protein involved in type VI secretion and phage assembly
MLTDTSGHERTLAGIVTQQRDCGLNAKNQPRVEVKSHPRLWMLSKTYAPLPYTVQYQETDRAFIERLLTSIGRSYWFSEKEGRDIVHFTDDNAKFTHLKLGSIPFHADAGLDKAQACFSKFAKGCRKVPAQVQVADRRLPT